MKTRTGFVSNSSSSSFIVGFSKTPKHTYDVLEEMFPPEKDGTARGVINSYGDESVDALTAATLVWQQIKEQKPACKLRILEEIRSGWFEGKPDYPFNGPSHDLAMEYRNRAGKSVHDKDADPEIKKKFEEFRKKEWEQYQENTHKAALVLLEKEFPKFKGKKVFVVSFSDNDGDVFSTLEHGDTFRHLPFIHISHH